MKKSNKNQSQPPKKRGGARKNAGRKALEEKRVPLTVYLSQGAIQVSGGKEALIVKITASVESLAFKVRTESEILQELEKRNKPNMEPKEKFQNPLTTTQTSPGFSKEIQAEITKIQSEKIPAERNTPLGRRAWLLEQEQRINDLKNKSK